MTSIVLGLLCALAIGSVATFYFWGMRRRQLESAAGVSSLSAMHWREFAGLVLEMLYRRGYAAVEQHPLGSGDQSDVLLKHDGELCVLWCKHGSASRLGGGAVTDLAESIRMNDATSGILVTPGSFAADTQVLAKRQRIELVDGKSLWPEISPLLPEPSRAKLQLDASVAAKRGVGVGWLLALLAGAAVVMLHPADRDAPTPTPAKTVTASPPVAPMKSGPTTIAKPAVAATPEQLAQRRLDSVHAIAALPGIEGASWSTQSTLSLSLSLDDARTDRWDDICAVLGRYDELRATRVQLNPPPGSDAPVRFRQCHAY